MKNLPSLPNYIGCPKIGCTGMGAITETNAAKELVMVPYKRTAPSLLTDTYLSSFGQNLWISDSSINYKRKKTKQLGPLSTFNVIFFANIWRIQNSSSLFISTRDISFLLKVFSIEVYALLNSLDPFNHYLFS